jgi:hypothetical protein
MLKDLRHNFSVRRSAAAPTPGRVTTRLMAAEPHCLFLREAGYPVRIASWVPPGTRTGHAWIEVDIEGSDRTVRTLIADPTHNLVLDLADLANRESLSELERYYVATDRKLAPAELGKVIQALSGCPVLGNRLPKETVIEPIRNIGRSILPAGQFSAKSRLRFRALDS